MEIVPCQLHSDKISSIFTEIKIGNFNLKLYQRYNTIKKYKRVLLLLLLSIYKI